MTPQKNPAPGDNHFPDLRGRLSETLEEYSNSLADLDIDKTLSFYRHDAVVADLVDHRIHATELERRQWLEEWSRCYRNLVMRHREILPAGNRVAVKWTLTGENDTGEAVCLRGVHMLEVGTDGRIEAQWCTFHEHPAC